MRSLRRPNVALPTLKHDGKGGKQAQKNLDKHDSGELIVEDSDFPDHWNEADVRGALYSFHGRVCAYCGRELPGNDRGDVEHFRPKRAEKKKKNDPPKEGYWWLAYSFENYFLACSVCNSSRKSARFPLDAGATATTYTTRTEIEQEQRILLDPAVDSIEDLLVLDFTDELLPVVPAPNLAPTEKDRLKQSIEFFCLNTDPILVQERIALFNELTKSIEQNDFDTVRRHAVYLVPHSQVALRLLEVTNQRTPTPEEAFEAHLRETCSDLEVTLKIETRRNLDERVAKNLQKVKDELLWRLAVWLHDPPIGTQGEMRQRFENVPIAGTTLLTLVQPYFAKI